MALALRRCDVKRDTVQVAEPTFGSWLSSAEELPPTLHAILQDAGRLYLPWVAEGCVNGKAEVVFASGIRRMIEPSAFLRESRAIMLARYREVRCLEQLCTTA